MDPTQFYMLQQQMQQPGGMFGGQPQAQAAPAQQPPAMGQPDPSTQPQHRHGFNPLMLLSPFGGLMASNPKLGMSLMSPAFGLANLFGAFK